MELKEKLVSLRKSKGLSQMKLAEMMNVSRQAVSRWEVGTAVPSIDNLKCLSEIYGITIDVFLNEEAQIPSSIVGDCAVKIEKRFEKRHYIRGVIATIVLLLSVLVVIFFMNQNGQNSVPIEEMENVPWGVIETEEFGVDW